MTPKRGGVEVRTVETSRSTPRTRPAGVETQGGYGGEFSTLHTTRRTPQPTPETSGRVADLLEALIRHPDLSVRIDACAAVLDVTDRDDWTGALALLEKHDHG